MFPFEVLRYELLGFEHEILPSYFISTVVCFASALIYNLSFINLHILEKFVSKVCSVAC